MSVDRAEGAQPEVVALGWRNWANLAGYVINSVITYASIFGAFGPDNSELSAKYQLLITPAGFAFSIWGPIFIWEGVFAVVQMFPQYRGSKIVELATPGWLGACVCQCLWTLIFAQEWMPAALVCMLGILSSLLMIAARTDGATLTYSEFFLLRGGFSLHMGWIIAASALNISVAADAAKASPGTLLGLAVASIGILCVLAGCFAFATKSPDPVICLVAAWAFNGIRVKLSDPIELDSPTRFNPYVWDRVTLAGLQTATGIVAVLALLFAAFAAGKMVLAARCAAAAENLKRDDAEEQAVEEQAVEEQVVGEQAVAQEA